MLIFTMYVALCKSHLKRQKTDYFQYGLSSDSSAVATRAIRKNSTPRQHNVSYAPGPTVSIYFCKTRELRHGDKLVSSVWQRVGFFTIFFFLSHAHFFVREPQKGFGQTNKNVSRVARRAGDGPLRGSHLQKLRRRAGRYGEGGRERERNNDKK